MQNALGPEVRKPPRGSLTRAADHLRDFFLRERDFQLSFSFPGPGHRRVLQPLQNEARHLLWDGAREPERADLAIGSLAIVRQLICDLRAHRGMLGQEFQEIVATDEIGLRGFEGLHRESVKAAGEGGGEPQDLPRSGDAYDYDLSLRRAGRDFRALCDRDHIYAESAFLASHAKLWCT